MAVEVLTDFPSTIVAGNTLRVDISNSDYPSDDWTLDVVFRGPSGKVFRAEAGDDNEFELVIAASDTAKLSPGAYTVSFVYTETSSSERTTETFGKVDVLPDPSQVPAKSLARKTLESMELALSKLAAGSNATFSANGQSFSKKNLKELQDAIDRQRAIVAREESGSDLVSGTRRYTGIGIRFA